MRHKTFLVFCAVLAVAVAGAVMAVGAQTVTVRRDQSPRAEGPRARTMLLDSRGSQLGVMVRDLEGDAAAKNTGVEIEEVTLNSAAEKAGLKSGDIVTEYDGERVRSARQFTRLVQETADGRTVKIAVLRNGQRQLLDATPEAREFSWGMTIDSDRILRDTERGLREFKMAPPAFKFRFDDGFPGMPSQRGRLGVSVESLSDQLASYFGAKDGGALVSSVTADSAAAKAGIKAGDVIMSVNGNKVRDADDVVRELAGAKADEVTIGLLRDKKETTVKATLPSRTDRLRQTPRRAQPAVWTRPA